MQIEVDEWEPDADALPLDFERHWRPRRPYAGRAKSGGYYRTTRERALTLPYVESNPKALTSLVITDHDGGRADEIAALCGLPQPSWVSLNRFTRDGHIGYALAQPVILTDAARRAPVNLLARIESGLNTALAGDVAYGRRFTKNPTHVDHMTLWGPEHAVYSLKDLADPLDRLGALPKWNGVRERREKLRTSGTGRNVDLFDLLRKWSYRHVRDHQSLSAWTAVCHDYAWDRNVDIIATAYTQGAMLDGEVRQIARSVSAWTWRNILRTFSEEQARRGRLGALATTAKLDTEQRSDRARKGGQAKTDAKREAARRNATKYDRNAIFAAAIKEA